MTPNQEQWSAVDAYIEGKLVPADPILDQVLTSNHAAGLPAHDVSPVQGKFLHLLTRMVDARKVLEIGTLGGYSTIWLARALAPGGHVVTLESEPDHARVAEANIRHAGLLDRVDLRVGPALATLAAIDAEGSGPYDLIFIDADKPNNPAYLDWALRLARRGTVIIADNVVRNGAVADPSDPDGSVRGVRTFLDKLATDPRVSATALQTVGAKGWDGFVVALVV